MDNNKKEFKPYIPADKVVPEFTVTALLIGILRQSYLELLTHTSDFSLV